jgi:S1-C subfamily serine protease
MRQIVAGRASADVHIGDAPFLGVQLSRDSAFASAGPAGGAVVAGVVSGSPAEAAGLSAGDTITSLDDTTVGSTTAFTKLLGQHHPADAVQIGWVDPLGGARVATVQLGTGPPA